MITFGSSEVLAEFSITGKKRKQVIIKNSKDLNKLNLKAIKVRRASPIQTARVRRRASSNSQLEKEEIIITVVNKEGKEIITQKKLYGAGANKVPCPQKSMDDKTYELIYKQ